MSRVWQPGLVQAEREAEALQALVDRDGGGFKLAAWDWRYFADRLRRERYAFDAAAIREHLRLDKVRAAAFDAASRLYGLTFKRDPTVPVYHPDVMAWSVSDRDGGPVGLLFTDYLARPQKHGGAWMGSLRVQEKLDGPIRPIIYTVANFTPSGTASEALLSLDEARTLFHEFGHALHGLLSDVTYPSLAGTAVARDFVEFPSKLFEHWIVSPEALGALGVSDDLITAIGRADSFGQGFATIEFLASALVDLKLHRTLPPPRDIATFEADTLEALTIPDAIGMRHQLAVFTHIFDGGYSSAYYSYLWSEVLDADVFEAFTASGDMFDPTLAASLRREVLAPGDSRDPMESFIAFRGREPDEAALLRSRCLV
jgi:peptidyl-dipeptidase Dcp